MARKLRVGAAQIGGIDIEEPREQVVKRHIALLEEAARQKVDLIVFPECSLTTYFPRLILPESEINKFFEKTMPNPSVQPLFDKAKKLEIAFSLGYSELEDGKHYNSSLLVGKNGKIIGKYQKSHIGGTIEPISGRESQYMERRYFLPGNTGFKVWSAFGGKIGMGICYDRRFPEFWRVMGMKGAELVLLGFLSGGRRRIGSHLGVFHHLLCLQAGAYWNGLWIVASAHCGMGHSAIVSPTGEIVAKSYTNKDELIDATIDLDQSKEKPFFSPRANTTNCNFVRDRRPDLYSIISDEKWGGISE
jgi:predicted amidohydrolase